MVYDLERRLKAQFLYRTVMSLVPPLPPDVYTLIYLADPTVRAFTTIRSLCAAARRRLSIRSYVELTWRGRCSIFDDVVMRFRLKPSGAEIGCIVGSGTGWWGVRRYRLSIRIETTSIEILRYTTRADGTLASLTRAINFGHNDLSSWERNVDNVVHNTHVYPAGVSLRLRFGDDVHPFAVAGCVGPKWTHSKRRGRRVGNNGDVVVFSTNRNEKPGRVCLRAASRYRGSRSYRNGRLIEVVYHMNNRDGTADVGCSVVTGTSTLEVTIGGMM